ncbi:MAG: acetylglutamate kinase [Omnitrophica bacterium RIFCSPLOWO2_12_FULL_44_17]|uniref:Acetylglutamate kinase n=1 Tax=Candidatus Danuiimicrobium aquiferis TaxID=1801832 RepID=A0A1G1L1K9_9BACT|nr:MAG: acetylglutamate kinase [Omnitrophica bacterium RIFCSPHIGHO2_02_FULL_45_28]OGW88923.1 MAG: acetylglutamate kinase [Omnitrophica bacterium RIFCSPHIGHO2_12_FULL_44_12]OGW99032.1 MAG: acetylglutamate kinase [Omnitrophica bacterium RIFCSPLOWO2_12_FULL_44_17]OGX02573.1 MAG: acetylglutamate kinase [Omnitrophica bacterium RIFCSPLOWO2_02_FULL_44_11]
MIEEIIDKADILIESLPYIREFRGKEILIKYGGAAMTDPEIRDHVLHDLVYMNYVGIRPILVHGGGPAITENLKKAGVESKFVNGLRVTDEATIKVVEATLRGLNQELVSDLIKFGAQAMGLSGHDARILKVKKHTANNVDIGFVGDVVEVNTKPIKKLTEANMIPVVFPIGYDAAGAMYNVNADEAAAQIAIAMNVSKVMVLTNVRGILRDKDDARTLISSLHVNDVEMLKEKQVISGGMIPKVNSCMKAINGNVPKAHIIDGRIKHALLFEIFTEKGIGTEIVK